MPKTISLRKSKYIPESDDKLISDITYFELSRAYSKFHAVSFVIQLKKSAISNDWQFRELYELVVGKVGYILNHDYGSSISPIYTMSLRDNQLEIESDSYSMLGREENSYHHSFQKALSRLINGLNLLKTRTKLSNATVTKAIEWAKSLEAEYKIENVSSNVAQSEDAPAKTQRPDNKSTNKEQAASTVLSSVNNSQIKNQASFEIFNSDSNSPIKSVEYFRVLNYYSIKFRGASSFGAFYHKLRDSKKPSDLECMFNCVKFKESEANAKGKFISSLKLLHKQEKLSTTFLNDIFKKIGEPIISSSQTHAKEKIERKQLKM